MKLIVPVMVKNNCVPSCCYLVLAVIYSLINFSGTELQEECVRELRGVIIYRIAKYGKEFLLLKPGKERIWTPPRGPTRPGENETIAIWRALEEFSGIKKKDVHVVPKIKKSLKYGEGFILDRVTYLVARLNDPDQQIKLSPKHSEYKWLYIRQVLSYVKKADVTIFEEVDEYLREKLIDY